VLAYAAAAVPEIMKDAGVTISTKRFEYIAELLHLILTDDVIRQKVLQQQRERLKAFSDIEMERTWEQILSNL
jgi:hypothetical protein